MDANSNETVINLLTELGVANDHNSRPLAAMAEVDSKSLRDLKLNLSAVLKGKNIMPKDAYLLATAIAVNEKHGVLTDAFSRMAANEGASKEELAETNACVMVMSTNNVFYRFRHYMAGNDYYEKTPAGMRMSVMMNPTMGKELFELMSLAISAVNGCERCVVSHEESVRNQGASEARIYDAIRLASVVRSACIIL